MSFAAPIWIAAIAALVLAAGAVTTSVFAIWMFGRQSRQLSAQARQLHDQEQVNEKLAEVLPLQAEELRDFRRERQRAQAVQVFIEVDRIPADAVVAAAPDQDGRGTPGRLLATVRNASRQPIYDLHVIWQQGMERMGKPDRLGRLMPGSDASFERQGPLEAGPALDPDLLSAFLAFRDAAGMRWAVREDGTLTDTSAPSHGP
jgi:hypothetical protein